MGIFEKRFERKPEPRISFFKINLLLLPLQMSHVDFNIYLLLYSLYYIFSVFPSFVYYYVERKYFHCRYG